MLKVRYEKLNDIRKDDEILNISFVAHPCYYSVLDLEERELFNKRIYENFCKVAERVDIYDKNEYLSVYRRHDKKCRELHMLKSWELLKNTYRYKMPVIFKNLEDFDLYNMEKISYYSINYNKKKGSKGNSYVVRNKKKINMIEKEKCFILDNHMIYSMTPEYIAKSISKNILLNMNYIKKGCKKLLSIKEYNKNSKNQDKINDNLYNYKLDDYYNDNMNYKGSNISKRKNFYPINKKRKIEPILNSNKRFPIDRKKKILIYLDPFAGAGGNCNHMNEIFTIGCDINIYRIKQCQHNCKFYNKNVDFILCDFFNLITHFRKDTIDVIFFSIPWGGPKYKNKKNFKLNSEIINNISVYKCIEVSIELTENLIFYLPRNVCMKELYYLFEYYKKLVSNKKYINLKNHDISKYDIKEKDMNIISNDKYYENGSKLQNNNNNMLLELYINRTRCNYEKKDDNSLNNFFYFLNQKCNIYDNKFIFSNVQNLFHINIDHCYNIFNSSMSDKTFIQRETYGVLDECLYDNIINNSNEHMIEIYDYNNNLYSYDNNVEDEKKEIKENKKYSINYYNKNDIDTNYAANKKKMKKKNIWSWHNTCMVLYLGNISSNIRNRKIINIKDMYYIDKKLSNILIDIQIDKNKCKHFFFSYNNFVNSQKKKVFFDIYQNKNKLFNNMFYINKNELIIKKKYLIKENNILYINIFIMKKLYNIIEKIILLFFKNIKNMIGYNKISFLNKICIQLQNVYHDKILTQYIDKHVDIKKYETYIYKDDDKKIQLCYIHLFDYFNIIIKKIKKEFILLFSIYLYDISYMKYYFRHKNVNIQKKKKKKFFSTQCLKKIHYNIIRILFNFLLYMKIYLNIVSNNIKLENYFDQHFVLDNMNIDNITNNLLNRFFLIYSLRKEKNTNYNFKTNNVVTPYVDYFKNFIKYIIHISINLELKENNEEKTISMNHMSNFFFRSLFNIEKRVHILINKLNNNINNNEDDIKYYKYNLYLFLIHFFTKQFLYNSHVNINLDYFNTLLFFYLNQVYNLSKHQEGYINIFHHFLNNFLYKNFFLKIK
ncbi:trimethylguanosine synthase, putative [Plasmodium sp. gorilla clade G2]|uniref:trimethylguanosine synthase, putative n=1 Tax=Plasmodium sp. gorilla clade G2 TaxID=880535 RepID=UPI000D2122DD|nr:trimethylguanosine synthase, putative [Plasmodium sp. gorilla clade G2]SOV16452.1 trimethylguanosine synthase, putative [Plasmodium sp. gorilla clade G2]